MATRIAILTSGRQDWGILRSTYLALRNDNKFEVLLWVGGMHLSASYGTTENQFASEGIAIQTRIAWPVEPHVAAEEQYAQALTQIGSALHKEKPDALLIVGDRFETLAAATAATLAKVPIIHLHGGEETEGAFDNAFRHAISKMSHLHFVSHPVYGRRLAAMGEDPRAVHVVGAPGLDNAWREDLASVAELEQFLGIKLAHPLVLVTVHPVTWDTEPERDAHVVVETMNQVSATYVITLPNSDPGNQGIRTLLRQAALQDSRVAVAALGERRYWGLLRQVDAMLGNSSSGLIEAPLLGVPVINVGDRQKGRLRSPTVIDVPVQVAPTIMALRNALARGKSDSLRETPLGDGHSGERIHAILADWKPPVPPVKHFFGAA